MRESIALCLAPLFLTGCFTMRFDIPPSQAAELDTRTVLSVGGQKKSLESEYTLSPVAKTGEVLLRDPHHSARISAYPKEDALRPPLLRQRDAPLMKGPIVGTLDGPKLTLDGPDDLIVIPLDSLQSLRILQVDSNKTRGLGAGVTVSLMVTGFFAAWAAGAFDGR